MSRRLILVFNAGSSSLKFSLFELPSLQPVLQANIERIGLSRPAIEYKTNERDGVIYLKTKITDHAAALSTAFAFIIWSGLAVADIEVIGHRVVHGGEEFYQPTIVDKKVLNKLRRYNHLAPLHNPINLSVISACLEILPKVKNIACFDTEWYKNFQPEYFLYPLPQQFYHKFKIRRYGFHGLSHEYVARQAAKVLGRPLSQLNLITCHLGSGASVTAVAKGKAVANSMGFTPLSGLPMASRSGDIDPNIIFYLLDLGIKPDDIYKNLNTQSGWLAIAGTTDFRQIMVDAGYRIDGFKPRAKQQRDRSKLALRQFVEAINFYIGGYAAKLKKVDAVVFTGGIGGENKHFFKIMTKELSWLKSVNLLQIPTNEELVIASKVKTVWRKLEKK